MNPGNHQFIPYPRQEHPRIGVVFPQTEFTGSVDDLRRFATSIEDLGYQHLLVYDHVLGASTESRPGWSGAYSSVDPFQEPFVVFGFLAAVAPKLEYVTGVLVLPQRQTALVAKQAANVDFLTGGNLRLGVGIGWNDVEYEALNETFTNRGRRLEEQIEVIRQLTSQDIIDYTGQWHRIDRAGIRPLGVQRPVPIWIGGSAEAAVRRAARIADGYFPNGIAIERIERQLAVFHDELRKQDRDPATVGLEARVSIAKNDPDDWKRHISHWRDAGFSHLSLVTMRAGFKSLDEHLRRFEAAMRVIEDLVG